MARRQKSAPVEYVTIRVNQAFNGMYKGDRARVPLDTVVQGWVRGGRVVVEERHGPGPA